MGHPKPEFLWVNNPWQLHFAAVQLSRVKPGFVPVRWVHPLLPGSLLRVTKLENSIGRAARLRLEEFLAADFPEFFEVLWQVLPRRELLALSQILDAERGAGVTSMRMTCEPLFESEVMSQLRTSDVRSDIHVLFHSSRISPVEWSANALLTLAIHETTRNYYNLTMEPEADHLLDCLLKLAETAHAYVCFENLCILCERPRVLHRDHNSRFHHESQPAISYHDRLDIYAWHGVRVPPDAILIDPSLGSIEEAENLEIRRVLIERYGTENYVLDSGCVIVHNDECGTLYLKELPPDEPILMVRVTNSTAEPDGEFKTYFLRVPPTTRTAREAVAWTFGLSESEYFPLLQT
jgi:hypothetical protein